MQSALRQGHKYDMGGVEVLAIEVANVLGAWRVREIDGEWLGAAHLVFPEDIKPLPMAYFHGAIPS